MKAIVNRRSFVCGCVLLVSFLSVSLAGQQSVDEPGRIDIAPVWSGHPVGFALLTEGSKQYVGYYDADRSMTVASRTLGSPEWTYKVLPTKVGWDSHNNIAMAVDSDGHLHVSGNMHVTPLIYFRTRVPGDISTLEQVSAMVGEREQRVTYPTFLKEEDGGLIFSYRDGGSGDGTMLYNRYDAPTRTWSRLLDTPMFDGTRPASIPRPAHDPDDRMNAYPQGPLRGPDGYWHMTWVWRDTAAAETNHNLSYARSKNLVNWETAAGAPLQLPLRLDSEGVVIDPIPVEGGIINGSGKIGFDLQGRPVVTYHKFDENGLTQVYNARFEDGAWNSRKLTDWKYRWDFRGRGSGPSSANGVHLSHTEVMNDPKLGLVLRLNHNRHGNSIWVVDADTLLLERQVQSADLATAMPADLFQSEHPDPRVGPRVRNAEGVSEDGTRYALRWETMGVNRDRAQEGPVPEPSLLQLIVITESD